MSDPAAAPPPAPPPVVVPRWIQLVVLPLALLGLWALARAAGPVLLVFVVASVIALILNPVVKRLERWRLPRPLAILGVYLAFFALLGGVGVLLANPVSTQVQNFQKDVPHLVRDANHTLTDVQRWLDRKHIGIHLQRQGQTALQTLQRNVLKSSGSLVSFSRDLLQRIVEISFALILVLVISVYMLLYAPQIGAIARRVVPRGADTAEDDYPILVQRAVSGYVRGQLLFSFVMGASVAMLLELAGVIGLFPDGSRYGLFFGIFFGLMELVPYIGPVLGALPPTLVALFNDPLSAVWLALMFLALQQLEGHVVAPQIFGHSLRINPLLIIFALLIGAQLYGIVGALVALPIAAVLRETIVYLRRHLVLEPWPVQLAGAAPVAGGSPAGLELLPGPVARASCPECGTRAAHDDAFCRSCGAPLAPRLRAPG